MFAEYRDNVFSEGGLFDFTKKPTPVAYSKVVEDYNKTAPEMPV